MAKIIYDGIVYGQVVICATGGLHATKCDVQSVEYTVVE